MTERVEFVSYSGDFPNLCRGTLVLRIDGVECKFDPNGHFFDEDLPNGLTRAAAKVNGGQFVPSEKSFVGLSSGGSVTFDKSWRENICQGPWRVSVSADLAELKGEIEKVVNENIEHGCCGGCV